MTIEVDPRVGAAAEQLARYIRFGSDDLERLARVFPLIEHGLPDIVEEFYERVVTDPASAAVFRDAGQIERQKQALLRWLARMLTQPRTDEYYAQTARIGHVHVAVSLPQRYMLASLNVIRNALLGLFAAVGVDDRLVHQSLHKALDLEMAVMSDAYATAEIARAHAAERREMQQRHDRLASIGTLAAGLAHEIRNPLNGAQLHLTFLRRQLATAVEPAMREELEQAVEVVSGEIKRLSRLVTEFLDFARPHALDLHTVDLREACRRAVTIVAREAQELGVELRLDLPMVPLEAVADVDRLAQVLINLLRNALEAVASPAEGSPAPDFERPPSTERRVIVRGQRTDDHRVLEIEDNGPGISDPSAPLFDPFFTTKAHGSGLGLSVAHRIVTDHGGTLAFSSAPGRTVFSIKLPRKESS